MSHDDLTFRTLDLHDADQAELAGGLLQKVFRGFHESRPDAELTERWLGYSRQDDMVVRGAWPGADTPRVGTTDLPIATFSSWGSEINAGAARLPVHLITDIGVSPTHRRRGLMRRLMDEDLRSAVDAGRPLAALTASEGALYGRFGFGVATRVQHVSVDVTPGWALREGVEPASGDLVIADPAESGDLTEPVFDAFHARTRGSIARPAFYHAFTHDNLDFETGSVDKMSHRCVHFDESGAPVGYVTYRHDGHKEGRSTVKVRDLVATTPGSYLRLWQFLADLDLVDQITWDRSPVDDPLTWSLQDPRRVRIVKDNDFIWLRVLDVPAALAARPWAADGDVVLDIADPTGIISGRWRVSVEDGRAEIVATDDAADVELDADTLGALYLGAVSTSTLARAGRLNGSEAGLGTWAAMADVGPPPYCPTGF